MDGCGVEVDQQTSQFEAANGNRKEASDCRGAGIFEAWASEGKGLEPGESHNELGDIVIVQLEGAFIIVASAMTEGIHVEIDQVPKDLNRGGEGGIGGGTGAAFDRQDFQGFLHFGQRRHTLRGGNTVF